MIERLSEEKLSEIETLARQARPDVDAVWMTGERVLSLVAMAREASANREYAAEADIRIAGLEAERDHYRKALADSRQREMRLLKALTKISDEGVASLTRRDAAQFQEIARMALADVEAT